MAHFGLGIALFPDGGLMQLPIDITFREVESTPAIEEYVRTEAAKLERYFSPIIACSVIVERPHRAPSGAVCHVRLEVTVPQGQLVVSHDPSLHGDLRDLAITRSHIEPDHVKLHTHPRTAIREAFRQMRRQLQEHARQLRGDVKAPAVARPRGEVVRLFPVEGYGFLEASDGREIYFHRNSVLNNHFGQLRLGSSVDFVEEAGDKGPQASSVRVLNPRRKFREAAAVALPPQPAS
jgi:cold shock CspA family protein/ribosome-associated translation inhibitor RaiA